MAYSNAIPAANDKLSQSQLDILNNFIALKTAIEINHMTLNDADQGKHIQVSFTDVTGSEPSPAADEIHLFSADMPGAPIAAKSAAPTGGTEIWLNRKNGATDISFPLTAATMATEGWCYLPSGIIMKWGEAADITATNTKAYTFATGNDIPVFAAVFYAGVTPKIKTDYNQYPIVLHSYNTTTITLGNPEAVVRDATYMVLGY